jgi:hypothetical protein
MGWTSRNCPSRTPVWVGLEEEQCSPDRTRQSSLGENRQHAPVSEVGEAGMRGAERLGASHTESWCPLGALVGVRVGTLPQILPPYPMHRSISHWLGHCKLLPGRITPVFKRDKEIPSLPNWSQDEVCSSCLTQPLLCSP